MSRKKGFKHSKETKEKIRNAHLGVKRPGIGGNKKGFKHTEKTKERMSIAHKGFRHTEETKKKISGIHKGKNFTGIKNGEKTRFKATGSTGRKLLGDNGYRCLHKWVVRLLGQPTKCSKCGKDNLIGRQIHWANISGEYKKDINDWERLCVKCHFKKDRT